MGRRWMLATMLVASLTRRKSRVAIAFAAIVIGAAVSSGLANVYLDIDQKMSRELRTFGANMVLTPATGEQPYLSLDDISSIAARIDSAKLVAYAPYLYLTVEPQSVRSAQGRLSAGAGDLSYVQKVAQSRSRELVLVGTRLDQVAQVSPYWKIAGETSGDGREKDFALVGELIASKLALVPGDRLALAVTGASGSRDVLVGGILTTGGDEDNQVIVDLDLAADLQDKHGVASVAFFSIVGGLDELESLAAEIQAAYPGVSASPIMRVSKSEGQVLEKIKSLAFLAVGLILLLSLLCVAITMMNIAVERRREIGLRKALGAQDRDIMLEFLGEGSALGLVAGLVGWTLGLPFAQLMGQSVFQSSVSIRPVVLPLAVLFSVALAALATFLPARSAARVQPVTTLKGD